MPAWGLRAGVCLALAEIGWAFLPGAPAGVLRAPAAAPRRALTARRPSRPARPAVARVRAVADDDDATKPGTAVPPAEVPPLRSPTVRDARTTVTLDTTRAPGETGSAGSSAARKQTFLEQAAAADLDQAELELKLASLKGELQAINKKMIATLRRRRKLLKQNSGARIAFEEAVELEDTFTGSIDTFCTAEEYDMEVAFRRLRVWSRGNAKFLESATVVHVRTGSRWEVSEDDDDDASLLIEAGEGDVFVFPYGVVVCWGLTDEQTEELQTVLKFCERRGYVEPEMDHFSYTYGFNFDYVSNDDTVVLTTRPSDTGPDALERSVLEKLAASHGFAQSARLEPFAESVQKSLEDTRFLAAELAATGAIVSQNQKDIARTLGRLILDRHNIYLYADVLDAPDVCWENPDLDPLYRLVAKSLELAPRVELLNNRVEIVRELLVVLAGELQNKHASRLEEIIIWLITVEIVIELVKDLVPMVTEWVQNKAALSVSEGGMAALQSAGVQTAVVASVTLVVIVVAGAVFSWAYWWWSNFNPAKWIKKMVKSWAPPNARVNMHQMERELYSSTGNLRRTRSQVDLPPGR